MSPAYSGPYCVRLFGAKYFVLAVCGKPQAVTVNNINPKQTSNRGARHKPDEDGPHFLTNSKRLTRSKMKDPLAMRGGVWMMYLCAIESAGFENLPRSVWHQQCTEKEQENGPN